MSGWFEGWYFKHQSNGRTLAVIPGRVADSAFVQVITGQQAYRVDYPLGEYRKTGAVRVGDSVFSIRGVRLSIEEDGLSLHGAIRYGGLTRLRGDIMGPFQFFPMECRHAVISMAHSLYGSVALNGEAWYFNGGKGYIEADSGYSFPEKYAWIHCNDFTGDAAVMASIAKIPFLGHCFWGCICAIWLNGREYRIATYKGAKIIRRAPGGFTLEQGAYRLEITANAQNGHELAAPRAGAMSRTIRESASCPARFRFTHSGKTLLDEKSGHASYECMM